MSAVEVVQLPDVELAERWRELSGWWAKMVGEFSAAGLPLRSTSNALEAFRPVKAGAGTCLGLSGVNSNAAQQYIQVFDVPNATALATGIIPKTVLIVPGASNFSIDYGIWGRAFSRGIVVANSSTLATYTAGSADCWFDVLYV